MTNKPNTVVSILTRSAAGVIALAVAVFAFVFLYHTRPVVEPSDESGILPPVLVMPAQPMPVQRQWSGYGTAAAMDAADVPARVSAIVIELPPEIQTGARVETGQLLVRLDESDFERQVEISTQAIADLEAQLANLEIEKASWQQRAELAAEEVRLAEQEFDRVKDAVQKQAAQPREADQARQALIAAIRNEVAAREELDKLLPRRTRVVAQQLGQEAALALARQNLQRCTVASPFSGVLQSVDVDVGENLQVGQRVARLVSLDRIEVPLRLPAGARADVSVGAKVELVSSGAVTRTWMAEITRIAPEDDETTRTMTVYVEPSQAGDAVVLPPGTFLRGTVTSQRRAPRWVVPRGALAGDRLLLVERGVVTSRSVEVDYTVETTFDELAVAQTQWVVLRTPLAFGDLVMLNASRALPEGSPVRPVPVQAVAQAAAPATPGAATEEAR